MVLTLSVIQLQASVKFNSDSGDENIVAVLDYHESIKRRNVCSFVETELGGFELPTALYVKRLLSDPTATWEIKKSRHLRCSCVQRLSGTYRTADVMDEFQHFNGHFHT